VAALSDVLPIEPPPPRSPGRLPWLRSGPALLRDPTAFFMRNIQALGPTFSVDAFGYRLLCLFSPEGVKRLYALPEHLASKAAADLAMLSHKVPTELWAGRRNFPHQLFGGQDVETYLENLDRAVDLQLAELGRRGRFELFEFARRLGHRVGLASWAGLESASPRFLDRLIPLFERLDASESFVHPARAFLSAATRKSRERRAMLGIESLVAGVLGERRALAEGDRPQDFLEQITRSWSDVDGAERVRGVARDLIVIHMGSQSNLYAAMAWTLIDLLERPELVERVRAGDDELLERCASESTRMAQRSLTLRRVMRPLEIEIDGTRYGVARGVFLATMLSVTNTTSAPGLARYDPDHYVGRRLVDVAELPARELVSTFGHGAHACPAQRFAISSIRISVGRLLERFDLVPGYRRPLPLRRQIGGVARADRRCPVDYRLR